MEEIKAILENLNKEEISELLLTFTGNFSPDNIKIIQDLNNNIEIISESEGIKDIFYGREIQDKYYFARHEFISKEKPYIDYYEEFFSNGTELKIGGL